MGYAKNDSNDAEAICEAVTRPNMRFVPVKSAEQQALSNLLVQGARSVLNSASRHQDRMSQWILELLPRRGYYRTLVAIANKNARIAWALLAKDETLHSA